MKKIKKIAKIISISIFTLILAMVIFVRLTFGGGQEYQDISTNPKYNESQLELFFTYDRPIGNVAVSQDTINEERVFFTVHPESKPEKIKLLEIRNGIAKPYPDEESQSLFNTVLGIFVDNKNRLWTLDYGNNGMDKVKLIAFSLSTNKVVHQYTFPETVAKKLSFFNDLTISPDGKYLVVANVSFFGRKPSLAVYNIETGESKNLLERHPSVMDEGYVPVSPKKKMRFFGGLVDLLGGVDGIDFSKDGKYVYYAPISHSKLSRIPTTILTDFSKSEEELANATQTVAQKPMSDGIKTDYKGNVYITDVEHQGIYVIPTNGKGFTLIKDNRIRWADGLSLSKNGNFYLADSDIPDIMLQDEEMIQANAPYHIFKFKQLQ